MKDLTAKEILEAGRAMIDKRRGWTRGELERDNGSVCALGAISKVALGHVLYLGFHHGECYVARNLLDEVTPNGDTVDFNDKQRSKKCVLEAFDAAIQKAEAPDA